MKYTLAKQDPKLLRNEFVEDNFWGMPTIKKNLIDLGNIQMLGYNNVKSNDPEGAGKIIHFFIDDYKFSSSFDAAYAHVSKQLEIYEGNAFYFAKRLAPYDHVITPDFSIRPEMPLAVQMMATFKNRWVGAYWQSRELSVIPSVCWGGPDSFSFAFLGIERGSIVAISTWGCKRQKRRFMAGYNCMLQEIQPSAIICYDYPFDEMEGNIVYFPHRFSKKGGVA